MISMGAVGGTHTFEVVAFHHTGETFAFADGGHVDKFASGELFNSELVANGNIANVVEA